MGWLINATPRPIYPPVITWYPLYRSLVGPQGRSRRMRKISSPPGFDPRTFLPLASSFADYPVHAHKCRRTCHYILKLQKIKPVNIISKNLVSPSLSSDRLTTANASRLMLFRVPVVVYCGSEAVTYKKCGLSTEYLNVKRYISCRTQ